MGELGLWRSCIFCMGVGRFLRNFYFVKREKGAFFFFFFWLGIVYLVNILFVFAKFNCLAKVALSLSLVVQFSSKEVIKGFEKDLVKSYLIRVNNPNRQKK